MPGYAGAVYHDAMHTPLPTTPLSDASPTFLRRVAITIATGFGLGRARFAPGTVGSLLGIPLVLAFSLLDGRLGTQVALAVALTLAAVPVCDIAERAIGRKDPGCIVADEYLLLPIPFLDRGPLWHWLAGADVPRAVALLVAGFAIARVCDILKPSPVRQSQALPGGWGIVIDDFLASLYAWVLLWGFDGLVLARILG